MNSADTGGYHNMKKNQHAVNGKQNAIETFEFEPAKGYPMLSWNGKRSFTSIPYYPAQLTEIHGEAINGWLNEIHWGDNLEVMGHLLKKYKGKIDLIYIDPPFNSNANYKKGIFLKGKRITNERTIFKEKQYSDIWTDEEYLQFMYERLILCRELLAETGCMFVHVDWRQNSYIRILMDELFGREAYRNEIRWKRQPVRGGKASSAQFARNSDTILFYTKSNEWTWNGSYKAYDENFIKTKFRPDKNGRLFRDSDLGNYSPESIRQFEAQGRIYVTSSGKKRLIRYLDEEKGESLGDMWTDIPEVNSMADERVDYPTQKPLPLLERIIKACSNPGDIVFDCFMGSGTTQVAAMRTGRKFIGADINLGAVQTVTRRLINVAGEVNGAVCDATCYTGFSVHHVNREIKIDGGNAAFKKSEANVEIGKSMLTITNFHPVNLLQKLSVLQSDVGEWRELVDSVMIDFNYNGNVFSPSVVDVPGDDHVVSGEYLIPANAGNIKIRITDLLSETFEEVIDLSNRASNF